MIVVGDVLCARPRTHRQVNSPTPSSFHPNGGRVARGCGRKTTVKARLTTLEERLAVLEHELTTSRAQALSDALTGLANRRSIEQSFRELQSRGSSVVVALFDVDDFKGINDGLGHGVGDEVLCVMARTLRQAVRQDDLVGRLGGDEFVVFMLDVSVAQADHRLRHVLSALTVSPARVDAHEARFAVSCGAAKVQGEDTLSSALCRADQALYHAKRLGKNCVVCVTEVDPNSVGGKRDGFDLDPA